MKQNKLKVIGITGGIASGKSTVDEIELIKLNKITHPLIIEEIEKQIQYFRKCDNEKVVFLDCPLLFEMKLQYLTDKVWLVSTTLENQIARIIKRDNVEISEASKIISYQMPLNEKIEKSDIVIENNETKKELLEKIKKILKKEKY